MASLCFRIEAYAFLGAFAVFISAVTCYPILLEPHVPYPVCCKLCSSFGRNGFSVSALTFRSNCDSLRSSILEEEWLQDLVRGYLISQKCDSLATFPHKVVGRAMAQAIGLRLLTVDVRFQYQDSPW